MNEKKMVGAPSRLKEPARAVTVYLTDTQIAFAARTGKTKGKYNVSEGVRRALNEAMRDEVPFLGEEIPFTDELLSEDKTYGLQPAA